MNPEHTANPRQPHAIGTQEYGVRLLLDAVSDDSVAVRLSPEVNGHARAALVLHPDQADELAAELLARAAVSRGQQGGGSGG